jgi:hypothetical protein
MEKRVVATNVCMMDKKKFISNEIWMLTFSAAFQRAYIYSGGTEEEKKQFRNHLRNFIDSKIFPKYMNQVDDEEHLKSINEIVESSKSFDGILNNGKINFGISQKILNLYLKYRWCMGDIQTPPHFPVDRRIQENINYTKNLFSWTQLTDSKKYMELIEHVRELVQNSNEYGSIAEFELIHFDRKMNN